MDLAKIISEDDLEAALSEPYEEDVEFARGLDGDVILLGAGGKMGPTMARRVSAALRAAGSRRRVFAASRFTDASQRQRIEAAGATALPVDLLADADLASLPACPHVVYMVGMKFGSAKDPYSAWAMNAYLPGRVAEQFKSSRIAAFSTGNVYAPAPVESSGSKETDELNPLGEYAQSCLGRERILQCFSARSSTRMCLLRLNYAVEARYGVLLDIGLKIWKGEPVPLATSRVNVIWQGDANSAAFRSLGHVDSPPAVFNIAGPEMLSVREIAGELAKRLGRSARFEGEEGKTALLSDGSRARALFGSPRVSANEVLELVARWIRGGGRTLGKPTKFEVRDGRF